MRILQVEDDDPIGEAICQTLRDAAFAVDWVRDAEAALTAVALQTYAVMLLDLGLPRRDGLEVLRLVRLEGNPVPVLIVTARHSVEDRILGLDLGADDYLMKPFHVGELLARVRALTRRHGGHPSPVFTNGPLSLDPASREVRFHGSVCHLTGREYALLRALLMKPGVVLSRTELEAQIYGWDEEVESNAVEFLIHGVRRKLSPEVIKNVRGMGWMTPKIA